MHLPRHVLIRCLLLVGGLLPVPSMAEMTTLTIPDQGWGVTFDAPPLRPVRETDSNDHYMYYGNANLFTVALYVDTPACDGADTHENVLTCFWSKTGKEPLINQASVQKSCNSQYCKLSYDLENSFQGKSITQKHWHFLFAYRNKWANLHVFVANPSAQDLGTLEKFEQSFHYQ